MSLRSSRAVLSCFLRRQASSSHTPSFRRCFQNIRQRRCLFSSLAGCGSHDPLRGSSITHGEHKQYRQWSAPRSTGVRPPPVLSTPLLPPATALPACVPSLVLALPIVQSVIVYYIYSLKTEKWLPFDKTCYQYNDLLGLTPCLLVSSEGTLLPFPPQAVQHSNDTVVIAR